jgi:hypothetical protein
MNVQEHEKKLLQINDRFIAGTLSRNELEIQIAELLGENNLAYRLKDRLLQQVNEKLSMKLKERLSTREFFMRCDDLENQIIQSGFPFVFFQDEASLEEIEAIRLNVISSKTLMLCVISALKGYVDNSMETEPKAVLLHSLYLQLKNELKAILPFQSDCEDGFIEYLASKNERTELEGARESGSICIVCGSHAVSSKGAEWQCRDCGKRFRKH